MARPRSLSGKLRLALNYMIWGPENGMALEWQEAARRAGLRVRTMRLAIQKPHVRQYLNEQRRALLAASSAQNISRAAAIRDQDDNKMAAVNAIKLLESGDVFGGDAAPVRTPGICIQIIGPNTSR